MTGRPDGRTAGRPGGRTGGRTDGAAALESRYRAGRSGDRQHDQAVSAAARIGTMDVTLIRSPRLFDGAPYAYAAIARGAGAVFTAGA
jgi:hypothetical protein